MGVILEKEIMKKWIGLLELVLVACFNVSHIHYLRFLYLRQQSPLRLYPQTLAQTIMGLVIYAIVANVLAKSKVLSLQGVVA